MIATHCIELTEGIVAVAVLRVLLAIVVEVSVVAGVQLHRNPSDDVLGFRVELLRVVEVVLVLPPLAGISPGLAVLLPLLLHSPHPLR